MSKFYVPTLGPQSWQSLLADPIKHWSTGYSARTLAYSWETADGMPPEVRSLFAPDAQLLIAIPEHKVSLGDKGRESQSDLFAIVKADNRTIATAIEGKVNESFGPIVKDWYANPSAGKQRRLAFLCGLLGLKLPPPDSLHYQLLHRTASAVIEADRFKTDDAAMIVHSFSTENKWFEAYAEFLGLFGLSAKPGEMVRTNLPNGRELRLGWAQGDPRFLLS
jgi:hypothetical protein